MDYGWLLHLSSMQNLSSFPLFLPQLTPSTQIYILNRETVISPASAHAPASEEAARSKGLFPHLNMCHRNHYQTFPV